MMANRFSYTNDSQVLYLYNGTVYLHNPMTSKILTISLKKETEIYQWAQLIEINKTIFCIGGVNNTDRRLDTVYCFQYYPEIGPIQKKSKCPVKLTGCALIGILNKWIYVMGGVIDGPNAEMTFSEKCFKYSVQGDKWEKIPSMNFKRPGNSACVVNERFIYVTGGYNIPFKASHFEMFDTLDENQGWTKIKLKCEQSQYTADKINIQISPNSLLILGGMDDAPVISSKTWIFNFNTQTALEYPCVDDVISAQNEILKNGKIYFAQSHERNEDYTSAIRLCRINLQDFMKVKIIGYIDVKANIFSKTPKNN